MSDRNAISKAAAVAPLSALMPFIRHDDMCDAAAWEQRRRVQIPNYARPDCTCGLDRLLALATADAVQRCKCGVPAGVEHYCSALAHSHVSGDASRKLWEALRKTTPSEAQQ